MTNNNSRVVLLLIISFLGNFGSIQCRDSEGNPLNKKCEAPVVTEGDIGVMTFFLRDSIDLVSDRVFVSLKRAMKPEEVLAACSKYSPIKCESQNQRYQISPRIVNHQLTLHIPNITTAFEDFYVVHVYVNDAPEPADTCYLTVHEQNSKRFCSAPTVKEGDTGVMTFFFQEEVVSSSNHLTAKLAKEGDGVREIISCHRKVEQSRFMCDVKDKLFTVDGAVQHSLTMHIPSITRNLKGHYILEVMDNDRHLHHESCYLDVEVFHTTPNPNIPVNTQSGNQIADYVWIAIAFAFLLVVMITCQGIIIFRQASCRQRKKSQTDGDVEITMPLVSAKQKNAHATKRWFFRELSDEDENQFFLSKRNAPGSFLVKASPTNPENYILAVLLTRGLQYLTIIPEEGRLLCPNTGKYCDTLCEFVNYYKEHEINVKNKVWGRLTKPFEQELDNEWYFGKLAGDQAKKILQKNGPGSFLVMDSNLADDRYDLVLNYRGKILYFGIVPEDDGFRMLDTQKMFESVNEIVCNYCNNKLEIDEQHNYGKLCKPCKKDSGDKQVPDLTGA